MKNYESKKNYKNVVDEFNKIVKPLYSNLILDKKNVEERKKICIECEYLFKPTFSCIKCGCFMHIKIRTKSGACPIKKWNRVEV